MPDAPVTKVKPDKSAKGVSFTGLAKIPNPNLRATTWPVVQTKVGRASMPNELYWPMLHSYLSLWRLQDSWEGPSWYVSTLSTVMGDVIDWTYAMRETQNTAWCQWRLGHWNEGWESNNIPSKASSTAGYKIANEVTKTPSPVHPSRKRPKAYLILWKWIRQLSEASRILSHSISHFYLYRIWPLSRSVFDGCTSSLLPFHAFPTPFSCILALLYLISCLFVHFYLLYILCINYISRFLLHLSASFAFLARQHNWEPLVAAHQPSIWHYDVFTCKREYWSSHDHRIDRRGPSTYMGAPSGKNTKQASCKGSVLLLARDK